MAEICCATAAPFVQTLARVVQHEAVSSRYFLLRLQCAEIAARAVPGQFVMLACAEDGEDGSEPLLPRPLAILDARGDEIELLYFVAGRGTAALKRAAEAAGPKREVKLRIIGPLGRGFTPIPDVDIHIALGGGSGVAPLVFFFRRFAERNAEAQWHLILAARNAGQLARADVVATPGIIHPATDDGSAGFKGTAVAALESILAESGGRRAGIYAAGPEPMMLAAARVARRMKLPARVTLESRMACGVGVCRACVVDGLTPHPKTGLLRRTVCQDGPVFDIERVEFRVSI